MIKFIKKRFKLIIIALLVVAVGFGGYYMIWGKKVNATTKIVEYTVRRKNIDVTISGSGAVTSTYRQDVSSEAPGTILKAFHNEGDKIKAGDALFQLDDSNAASTVERTRMSIKQANDALNKANENIINLDVKTPISGQVSNILVNVGDNVNKGQEICTVTDTSNLKVTVPFNGIQIKNIYVGEAVDVFLQDYMDTVSGTVTYVSNAGKVVSGGGSLYMVEISINNPGSIISGSKASAKIGDQYSIDSGLIQYVNIQKVRAQSSGAVQNINIRDQQQVSAGQIIVKLSNDDLSSQVEDSQIKLQDLQVQLDSQVKQQNNYKIAAVIDGTITSQTAKAGDVIKSADILATVSNPDAMQFNISVDELDIAKISVGMSASVTLDALPGKKFEGVVSKISGQGTSTNGVTTYPVTVVIQNPDGIREGMNANADIQVQHKDEVLTLPIAAVQKMRNSYFVFVKSANGASASQGANQWSGQKNSQGRNNNAGSQQNGQWQGENGSQRQSSSGNNQRQSASGNSGNMNSRQQNMLKLLGPGVSMKMVQVGINNDNDIEITGGLNEGDVVVVPVTTSSSSTQQQSGGLPFGGGMGGLGGGQNRNYGGGNNQNRSSGSSQSGNSGGNSQNNSGGGNRD